MSEGVVTSPENEMRLTIEVDQEEDGRFLAEVVDLPGVLAYGESREEALALVQALALRVLADRVEHGEPLPEAAQVFAVAAPSGG
jgi:predicted RNase H-like HicB family nuclease